VSKPVIIGWVVELVGTALWLYGYLATGNPSLIDWHASTPWWIADYLPNIESEIGMVLVFTGMLPIYWPSQRNGQTTNSAARPEFDARNDSSAKRAAHLEKVRQRSERDR
jgi:protein-S-isoprenylcysteine O-methyltransferase Ste14